MKLYAQCCAHGFTNCYILGGEKRDALIIDPGEMDARMLKHIEENNYTPRAVLVTHSHLTHIRGLRTFTRIYDVDIYAASHVVQNIKTIRVKDGDTVQAGSFSFTVIMVPGHSSDSVVYRFDRFLFTGDILSAGLAGTTISAYGSILQATALRSKLFSLPGDYQVFPGHGPPTTLEVERGYNASLESFDMSRNRRPTFRLDF